MEDSSTHLLGRHSWLAGYLVRHIVIGSWRFWNVNSIESPISRYFLRLALSKVYQTVFWLIFQFLGNQIRALMSVWLNDFHNFVNNFSLPERVITRTEALEPQFCCFIRWFIESINCTHFLTAGFLSLVILKDILNFRFYFTSILERSNRQWDSLNTTTHNYQNYVAFKSR